ncbi:helix-turn-helix domain-containing protein [Catenulispora sp. NL8]|uniref:Helix-turn-helix domain-containing protein n=1 Tax=Catenulispora pinistramenti TaxID=2705254 RepID=A0ABS5KKF4_9ACTN|nr:helix-turn-helix domain-containing protein [Catenulispora pinistramenti]
MALTSPFVIELTGAEREDLEHLADSRTAPFGQVQRASVILAMADGMSNAAVSKAAGRHVDTVRTWRKRFAVEWLAVLTDRPRPASRPRLSPAVPGGQTTDHRRGHRYAAGDRHRVDPPAACRTPGLGRAGRVRLADRPDTGRRRSQTAPGPRLADSTGRPGVLHQSR